MIQVFPLKSGYMVNIIRSVAVFAVMALLSACASQPLWQGEEVLVEARQQALEQNVGFVSEDHRELRDRFNALERLYVELVQHVRAQESQIADMSSKVATVEKDPQVEASVNRVKNDVTVIRDQLKKLENRLFSVEMADTSEQSFVAETIATPVPTAPTGRAETNADASTAVETDATPVANVERNDEAFFGVHLASFRSKDQVGSGWNNLAQTFAGDLQGLTPLLYVQSQEGIGTFMRLVAGPLINEQEADALCGRIKRVSPDQYCRVSEYQGEPIT